MSKLNFQILDCTLRDGGYYTNWDFDKNLVRTYLESLNQLPIDYIEVGYRSPKLEGYYGEYFYCPDYVLKQLSIWSKKKLVIILNEKDVRADMVKELLGPCLGIIQMVRIALDPQHLLRAKELALAVKEMGFEVGFNVMYMSKWKTQPTFIDSLPEVNQVADYFYMVDSYGGVYPEDVSEIYDLVSSKLDVPVGFHGHNNLELGLVNTLTAIGKGSKIVDSTITGMGRGAGNLKTELLLTALNQKFGLEVDFNALATVTDAFVDLQKKHEWGTNLPYMVSGANSLPQKEVMDWVGKRYYSLNSIIRALYHQKNNNQDEIVFEKFLKDGSYNEVLIIGGGNSVVEHQDAILEFIKNRKDICLIHASSRNAGLFKNSDVKQYFCLVGNEGLRLEKVFNDLGDFNGICILPPSPRKMGTYVPEKLLALTYELSSHQLSSIVNDSHTAIALHLASEIVPSKCFLVGYDGYTDQNVGIKEQELFMENDALFEDFKTKGLHLFALTSTKYKNLFQESIYSDL